MDGSLERLVFPSLIADGYRVQGFTSDAYWMDVGTSERYTQLHADILAGRIDEWLPEGGAIEAITGEDCQVWGDAVLGSRVVLGRNCRIGGLVTIAGPTVVGDSCDVRDKACIERSIIWSGSKIGSGTIVRDSIIGSDVWIGDNAVIDGAIIANGARVKRGVHLPRGARLEPEEVAG
jgi:mannose-1-phosphate guanylyltransferase